MENERIKAVKIIQKNFRLYLKRRTCQTNLTLPDCELSHTVQNNLSNNEATKSNEAKLVNETQKQIHKIYVGLDSFYNNLPASQEFAKHMDNTLTDIEVIILNLQRISNLEDCVILKRDNITKEARLKHQEALNNLSVKWWENLNLKNNI